MPSNPMCIVLSTHHSDEAELIANDLLVLENGQLRFFEDKNIRRKGVRESIFRVLGDVPAHARIDEVEGLIRWSRVFGDHGLLLYFNDVITIRELVKRLEFVERLTVLSVTDLSASTSNEIE
jgi:hypothetical protein